ncbi:DUF6326 family protein [Tenacibaculum singaporense]|uniref:DUF6326 family protein n=1 Tax=Tenacibaculum singaporense TaxID=2358479 RepID=UPI000F679ADF|nr:DUF6326 family protein [Tenacibaculum singaporense]RSC92867.1 hypothetical protein EI424_10495 [Tenacibaculum singaporense]
MNNRVKLSNLWILVMFNMIFADIFSIIIALTDPSILDIPGDAKIFMGIAVIITNIPILMIFLSRILPYKLNRIANIMVGASTIIYVIGGGSVLLHYIIIASIEVILLILIIRIAFLWKDKPNFKNSKN